MLKPLLLLFSLVFSFTTSAAQELYGRVNINGVIINPACTISADNAEQIVNLGVITQEKIDIAKEGLIYPFAIHLTNCILATTEENEGSRRTFRLRFDGPTEPGSRGFTLGEQNQGLAFEIHDEQSNTVTPGEMMILSEHSVEKKILNYSLHLIKTSQQVKSGPFQTAVNFTLVYQ